MRLQEGMKAGGRQSSCRPQPYADVLDFVEHRLQAMCNWLSEGTAAGDLARQRLVNEGHLDYYRREIAAFQKHRPLLQRILPPRLHEA